MEDVYEQFFFMQYKGGWSFIEAYNLPVGLRGWFVSKLIEQLISEKEALEQWALHSANLYFCFVTIY